jgi:dihydrofolate synthase/folylpolyglutamate synthase
MNLKTGYQQTLDYLYSFIDYETMHQPRSAVHYDLRRMDELLLRLGNPHLKARTIHIAGTKGKGSTAAMIASVLTTAGYKTGLYTSPHLIDLRERIRIDGKLISKAEMAKLTERLKTEAVRVNEGVEYGKLTTFELLTTLGFMFFAEQKADFQVMEVGLGGRLDATNVVNPEVCVITTIGLDHTDILGHTLAQIAGEKAGIIKPGVPVVSACQKSEAAQVIIRVCHEKNTRLICIGKDISYIDMGTTRNWQLIDIHGRLGDYRVKMPLLGQYQQANGAAAVGALEVLVEKGFKFSQDKIISGLGKVHWPGRFQVIQRHPLVVVDGAHNPAAAHELKKAIGVYPGIANRHSILVIGTSSDKDYAGMAQEIAPTFDAVVVTRSSHPRSLDISILAGEFQKHGIEVQTNTSVAGALAQAVVMAGENGFVCATGSLFIVGEALAWAHRRGY